MITPRLILAVLSTLLEEAAILVIVLWGLPELGVSIPTAGLIAIMVLWAAVSVAIYQVGTRALEKGPVIGLPDMIGSRGKAVGPLVPGGVVRIKSELWEAESAGGEIGAGEEISVVGQQNLKLTVRKLENEESFYTGGG